MHLVGGEEAHIVFPAHLLKSDGVDVLIEDESKRYEKNKDTDTLGADGIGDNLEGVRYRQGDEGKIERSRKQENEGNDGVSGRTALGNGVTSGANGLEDEEN